MRRIEQQDISYDQAVGGTEALTGKKVNLKKQSQSAGQRPETRNTNIEIRNDLKKQSQLSSDFVGATPFMANGYGDFPASGRAENKANLGPFQTHSAMKAGRSVRCSSDI
jgi:hypothetical protein